MDRNNDLLNFTAKYLCFKKAYVANFAESSRLQPRLLKKLLKLKKELKRIRN